METLPASNQSGTFKMPTLVRSCNIGRLFRHQPSLHKAERYCKKRTEGMRIPATAVMANLQCTSSACWYLQCTRDQQHLLVCYDEAATSCADKLCCQGPETLHGSPPSKGLLLGTELERVEAVISWQVAS